MSFLQPGSTPTQSNSQEKIFQSRIQTKTQSELKESIKDRKKIIFEGKSTSSTEKELEVLQNRLEETKKDLVFTQKEMAVESVPSKTLLNNPDAVLDPSLEINEYFKKADPKYLEQLNLLNAKLDKPMNKDTKLVFCIPVAGHQESDNIRATLESFSKQKTNPNNFEVLLFVNSPDAVKDEKQGDIQKTMDAIEKAKKDFPQLRIEVAQAYLPKAQVKIANIRKIGTDLALLRQKNAGIKKDLILVSNDADNQGVSEDYVNAFVEYFEKNKEKEAAVGNLQFDANAFIRFPEIDVRQEYSTLLDQQGFKNGNVMLLGGNSCMKSSIYSAIGGYPPGSGVKISEQSWTGKKIRELRKKKTTVGFADKAVLATSSRRNVVSLILSRPEIQKTSKSENLNIGKNENTLNFDTKKAPSAQEVESLSKNKEKVGQFFVAKDLVLSDNPTGKIYRAFLPGDSRSFVAKEMSKSEIIESQKSHSWGNDTPESYLKNKGFKNNNVLLPTGTVEKNGIVYRFYEAGDTDLEHYLEKNPKLSVNEALSVVSRIGNAVSGLNKAGIFNVDIAPSNTIIKKDSVKITDFDGCVIDKNGTGVGKRNYSRGNRFALAPEMFEENPVFGKTVDVYAASANLFRFIAGDWPYPHISGTKEWTHEKRWNAYKNLHKSGKINFPGSVPAPIQAIIKKGMSPLPKDRYQSMDEFMLALDNARKIINTGSPAQASHSGAVLKEGQKISFGDEKGEALMRAFNIDSYPIFDYSNKEAIKELRASIEKSINRTVDAYERGEKLGKNSAYYKNNLRKIGIEYSVDANNVMHIVNMDKFIQRQELMQWMIKSGEKNMAKVIEKSWEV